MANIDHSSNRGVKTAGCQEAVSSPINRYLHAKQRQPPGGMGEVGFTHILTSQHAESKGAKNKTKQYNSKILHQEILNHGVHKCVSGRLSGELDTYPKEDLIQFLTFIY